MNPRYRVNGYRVLQYVDKQEHTWDFDTFEEAADTYHTISRYDICMVLQLMPINVKMLMEKRNVPIEKEVVRKKQASNKKPVRRRPTDEVYGRFQ